MAYLKSSCHGYLSCGLTMFLSKKRLSKIKYGAEDSISNVDLDLFFRQTTNYCCFSNSERSTVNNALISTSLFSTSGEIILVSCVIIYKYFRPIIPFLFFSVGQQDFLCGTFVLPMFYLQYLLLSERENGKALLLTFFEHRKKMLRPADLT